MLYEDKLDKVIFKLKEERKITRKGHKAKVSFDDASFTRVRIDEIVKILLILQDDEKILKIIDAFEPVETADPYDQVKNDNYEGVDTIIVELTENFDNWYKNYLLRRKSNLSSLDYINLLRIYDVVIDIDRQIQISNKTTVKIPIMATVIKFRSLFPVDTIGSRNEYCDNRLSGIKYLKNKGIIDDYSHGRDNWDTIITISVSLGKFEEFHQQIKKEFEVRKDNKQKKEKQTIVKTKEADKKTKWSDDFQWDNKSFIFGKYGKIDFTSKDRIHILKVLTNKKGKWATISELKGNKDASYVRSTIKHIEDRLPEKAKKHISIPSTTEDDFENKPNEGAYRIKFLPKT